MRSDPTRRLPTRSLLRVLIGVVVVCGVGAGSALAAAPTISGVGVARLDATSARLDARVVPNGPATTFYVEYGTTSAYGASQPPTQDAPVGSGAALVPVAAMLDGLTPATVYHFRVVAVNADGLTVGPDRTFTTAPAAQGEGAGAHGDRAIELVSAGDKDQNPVSYGKLSADGTRALFVAGGGTPESTFGAIPQLLAERTAAGWQPRNALPPNTGDLPGGSNYYLPYLTAPDLSAWASGVWASIFGTPPSSATLVRLRDDATQDVLHEFPDVKEGEISFTPTVAASADLSHIFMNTRQQLDAEHVAGTANVYDFGGARPQLISRLPDGSVPVCGTPVNGAVNGFSRSTMRSDVTQHWVSANGDYVFFQALPGAACGNNVPRQLYVRDLTRGTTTLISGPVVAGTDRGLTDPGLMQAAADGSWVIYKTASQLELGDPNTTNDIYKYDVGTQTNTCLTCVVANANVGSNDESGVISQDGSHVYFRSNNQLTADAPAGPGLYVWSDTGGGTIRYVAPGTPVTTSPSDEAVVTPDGAVIVFASFTAGMTADNPAGITQYLRYDDRDGSLVCMSCLPGAAQTSVRENLSSMREFPDNGRVVSADGSTFAFRTDDPLVPQDINDGPDVYEWRDGRIGLVTDGRTPGQQVVIGEVLDDPANPGSELDGRDILFTARGSAAYGAPDTSTQMYVARIGGGFPRPAAGPVCDGDHCQASPGAPPALAEPGSVLVTGVTDPFFAAVELGSAGRALVVQRAVFRRGALLLRVRAGAEGPITARAIARLKGKRRTVARGARQASKPGPLTLRLRLTRAARKQLANRGRLHVAVRLAGAGGREHVRLVLRRAKGGKHAR